MELQDSILKGFADAVNSGTTMTPSDSQHLYATVTRVVEDSLVYVKLNGADVETPAKTLVQVGVDDLVMCTMRGHTLTIIGNVSYPALTRVGDVYMTLTDEGLLIGRLSEDNQPIDGYIIVGTNGSSIYNIDGIMLATFGATAQVGMTTANHVVTTNAGVEIRNGSNKILADFTANGITLRDSTGAIIASFAANAISIGQSTSATVSFCGGKANIALDGSTLKISGGSNVEAIGMTNSYGNYKSEVVCEAKNNSPKAALQLLNGSNTIASLVLSNTGVNVFTSQHLTENGIEVVKVNEVFAYGTITWKITPGTANRLWCTSTPNVPSGYTLIGLCRVTTNSNYNWGLDAYTASPQSNSIRVEFSTHDDTDMQKPGEVYATWFAIRTSGAKVVPNQSIDW